MMMPNLVKHIPQIVIPVIANAVLSAFGAYILNTQGVPETAGFGIVGLVGPIQAANMGTQYHYW